MGAAASTAAVAPPGRSAAGAAGPGRVLGIDATLLALLLVAAAKLAAHTLLNFRYGFHRDELATLDDARHLAWGFVAYPPLTPFLGRVELALFGTSLAGFRFLAAAAQALAMVLAARLAHHLGGDRRAQWLTAAAVAVAPASLGASSLLQYVSFDYLWWVLIAYLLVRRIASGDRRWWLAIGAVIGLAVLTKYAIAFYLAGLALGVLLSPLRSDLRSRWLWLGAAVALMVALPHLIWEARHGFVTFELLREIHARDVRIGRTDGFLLDQLTASANPVTIPLWMAGLTGLVAARRLRPFRPLFWMATVPFLLFLLAHGRGYYLAPVYPMLLAAGAVLTVQGVSCWRATRRRWALAAAGVLLVAGAAVALVVVPAAPLGSRWFRRASALNGDLVEELGWPELVAEVGRIYRTLPAGERPRTAILCANYGEAGAIDLYGPALGLSPAISGVNSYWARGYGDPPPLQAIVLGAHRERLEQRCRSVELVGHPPNPWQVENEETRDHPDIFLCRGPRVPWEELWPQLRSFG